MNVHQGIRRALAHKAAVQALLTAEPPPLPALYHQDPLRPGHPDPAQPLPIACIELRGRSAGLRIPKAIPIEQVPALIAWLVSIQADVPAHQAYSLPDDSVDDPGHPDYIPHPGADG